ncbi:12823_t:CDS:10 [Rhizophagus irregularis]|nr:12823_t:CDS:10 [Rhizophagus irregularis]
MAHIDKRVPNKKQNIQSLSQNNLCHKQSRYPEIQKQTWDTYTVRDLEILSDIITLATYTSRSLTEITPFSYMSLFRAYDVVLSTRRIDAKIDTVYYQFLLKLSLVPGNNWGEKFENSIKDLGLKSDIEQRSLIFNKSDGSESDYTIESNISLSSLDHGIENTSFDNDINFKANEIALEQNYDNVEESFESSTKVFSQSRISNTIDYKKRSPMRKDFFNIEGSSKSEVTLKGDYSILEKNALNDDDLQEMERLKEKLRICFKEWSKFTIKIRAFRAKGIRQWKLAINFHQKNLLKSYFHKLKNNYQKQLVNKKLSDEKCKELVMRKYLIKWYHRKQYVSYIEEQVILIGQRNLLKRHFERWLCRIQHIDNHVQLAKRHKNQCCGRLLNKFFTKCSQKYNYIEEGTEDTLAQRVFDKWRDRYNNNISLAEMAEDDYNTKLIKNAFIHWKRANGKRQKIIKEIDMQLKNRYFVEWYSKSGNKNIGRGNWQLKFCENGVVGRQKRVGKKLGKPTENW